MPNRDGRGPSGVGPRTGKRLGNCNSVKKSTEIPVMDELKPLPGIRNNKWNDQFRRLFRFRKRIH